jgi:hypothetical protein
VTAAPSCFTGAQAAEGTTMAFSQAQIRRIKYIVENLTPEDKEAQRRSFAYGNAKLHNPKVTREDIDRAAERLKNGKNAKR